MDVLTSGQIAKELNVDRGRVAYALYKSNIQPIGLAGNVRLFELEAIEEVRQFLKNKRTKAPDRK